MNKKEKNPIQIATIIIIIIINVIQIHKYDPANIE